MPFLLKNFQRRTVEAMEKFFAALASEHEKYERVPEDVRKEYGEINWPEKAWHRLFLDGSDNHAYSAKQTGHGKPCPHFCLKLPTGGGKTLMATYALEQYLKHLKQEPTGLVLWVVPSEQIFAQTLNALKDRSHPYREKLDDITSGHIKIVTKKEIFSPTDVKKGLVILDEGHRAKSELALSAISECNPACVCELTATPAEGSNVLCSVKGRELEQEDMIKLDLNLVEEEVTNWQRLADFSIQKLDALQKEADKYKKQSGVMIRPINLIQVEKTGKDQRSPDTIHADDVKDGYYLIGWQRNKFYPDFIFTIQGKQPDRFQKVYVVETKGMHLGQTQDTKYKRELVKEYNAFFGKIKEPWGAMKEKIFAAPKKVQFELVTQSDWKSEINRLFS